MSVPKIFHHAWLSGNALKPIFVEWRMSWLRFHPDGRFMFWDVKNIPFHLCSTKGADLLSRPLKYVVKSDIIRWELLYIYGGIWVDTDMECLRSIEPLLNVKSFAGVSYPPDGVGNALIGFEAGDPLVAEIRDATNNAVLDDIDISFDNKKLCAKSGATFVGPNYLPRVAKIYPRKYFYPFGVFDRSHKGRMKSGNVAKTMDEYSIHHWSGTEKDGWGHVKD